MIKTLLVTGKLAEAAVRKVAGRFDADVQVLPVSVALFIAEKTVLESLKKPDLRAYGRIIFPGSARLDLRKIEQILGVQCFKGPRHVSDLEEVLGKGLELSKTEPADLLLLKKGEEDLKEASGIVEQRKEKFKVGNLKVGPGFPPKIIAEIVDAPRLSLEENLARARYYLKSGADIIDVGCISGEDDLQNIPEIIKKLKNELEAPVSIDSLNPDEINAGIDAGADMVLSLDSANMGRVKATEGVAYVVLPGSPSTGAVPKQKLTSLSENLEKAKKLGFRKLVADPILEPPFNTVSSLGSYLKFKEAEPGTALMMGVGNMTELMDADSPGMNALLASAAVELGVSFLLTTENSVKTRNAVSELRRSLDLNFLADFKKALPKDLGIDAFLAKSKTDAYQPQLARAESVRPSSEEFKIDPKGCFHIFVDFKKKRIIAALFRRGYETILEGANAEDISKEIIKRGLVSDLSHANYLGRELAKAEICLKLGKTYRQDEGF
ncbi:MAG: dihydropteroate synthase-like protein [Candidatus Altiarchaeota archaeon]|nr:dihydropteroate synthase-like protein [Candidatus Altiarchaeota archaeon]